MTRNFQYDSNGNRIEGANDVGPNNQLLSDGTFNYQYDDEGNRVLRTNTATGAVSEYVWDHRNRLEMVIVRDSVVGPATKLIRFEYDAFNHWIAQRVDIDGDGAQSETPRFFIHDNGQIVLEFDGIEAEQLSHRYLWGDRTDQLLADESVDSLISDGDTLWPLTDNLGTVRDLATYDNAVDRTTIANHRTYDAFGNLTSETDTAIDSLFGFTGRPFDEQTGLQNNLNRLVRTNDGADGSAKTQ